MHTHTLTNSHGMQVRITTFGARIISILVPDREGQLRDVVLGFDREEDYLPQRHLSDFGAAIGRYANRIGHGRFALDGQDYALPQNNGAHCLHGGPDGWQYRDFTAESASMQELVLSLVSPDGDNGFPGTVKARIAYRLTDDNAIEIRYSAETDRPTVINLTNHSYFNLSGNPSRDILDHLLTIDADQYTPIDDTCLPLGSIEPVDGTPLDFRKAKAVGRDIDADCTQLRNGRGYDHNWVLNTRGSLDSPCAQLECPSTGIALQVFTSEPGMQVYTGNFLDGSAIGKGGQAYGLRSAICLETQKFPNSPNNRWPQSDATLRPGQRFESVTRFKFLTSK